MTHTETQQAPAPAEVKTYDGLIAAVRQAALDGDTYLAKVVDDYEYDSSRWSAGPRKATAIIGLRVRVQVSFPLPLAEAPEGCQFRIDTSRGDGCWFVRENGDPDDPDDVMRDAFEGQDETLRNIVLGAVIGHYTFPTLSGLGRLKRSYSARDYQYRATAHGVNVSFTAEMEAY